MNGTPEKRTPGGNRASAEEASESTNPTTVCDGDAERKRFATAQARAALARHTLVRTADGFILARHIYSKHCTDLAAVEALLDRMGAPG